MTIGVLPTENQSERLSFLQNSSIFYIPFVADNNSKLYLTKKLLVCIAGTSNAFQYDVEDWEIKTDKELKLLGTTWIHRSEKYVVFHLKNEMPVLTPRKIAPQRFRYATTEGLKRYMSNPASGKGYFYLTNPDAAILFDELKKASKEFEIGWVENVKDPSLVEFRIAKLRILSCDSLPPLHFKIDNKNVHFYKLISMLRL